MHSGLRWTYHETTQVILQHSLTMKTAICILAALATASNSLNDCCLPRVPVIVDWSSSFFAVGARFTEPRRERWRVTGEFTASNVMLLTS